MSQRIKKVLMERDGMDEQEASQVVDEVIESIGEAVMTGSLEDAEDILMSELGLEPDYIEDILFMLA